MDGSWYIIFFIDDKEIIYIIIGINRNTNYFYTVRVRLQYIIIGMAMLAL